MLLRKDLKFKAMADEALKKQMASGAFARQYGRWFLAPTPLNGQKLGLPMSEALHRRVARPRDALDP